MTSYLMSPPANRGSDVTARWIPGHIRSHEMLTAVHQCHIAGVVKLKDAIKTKKANERLRENEYPWHGMSCK